MCIQWKAGQPYEDGRLMDYDALATWARSLEAGLEQLAQLPEGGSARALLDRSKWKPNKHTTHPYQAIPKVGTRKRVWLITNIHGGLKEEFVGSASQASKRADELSATSVPLLSGTAWENPHDQSRHNHDTA